MNRLLLLVASVFLLTAARADLLLQPTDHVALIGDGLSDTPCSIYLEDYLFVAEPSLRSMDIEQFGWTSADLTKLKAALEPFKPTAAILFYPYGDPANYEKDMTDRIELLKKAGVRLMVIGSPSMTDATAFSGNAAQIDADNQRRAAMAEITKKVAAAEGVVYADVFGVTQAALAKAKSLHGDEYMKQPLWMEAYQLAMASAFLKALGCDGDTGSLTIDYAAKSGSGSPGQSISPIQDGKFTVTSTQFPFWFPGHGVGGNEPPPWPTLNALTFSHDLNRFTFTVKNLPTVMTKIYWGDLNQDFPSSDLAKGVDIANNMSAWNPYAGSNSNIDNGVRGQQETERVLGDAANKGQPDPQANFKREAALQVVRDRSIPAQVKMVIQPLVSWPVQPKGPIPVILDTDLDGDVDDVGALALLNDFMDQGECNLLAVVHDTVNPTNSSCGTIKAIDDWYGHPDIPIGQYLGEHPTAPMTSKVDPAPPGTIAYHDPPISASSSYTPKVRQRFEPNYPDDDKCLAGVDVYRKALANAPDGQVVICTVGVLHNVQDLMLSQPDSISPLSGMDLIKKKVRLMVNMANTTPADSWLLTHWPKPILWTTYVGSFIGTGPSLISTPENNPVRMCYDLFGVLHGGRQSWDLTAAWLAVRGPGDMFDILAGRQEPYISDITKTTPGPDEYTTTIKMPYSDASKVIGDELARPPKR